MISLFLGLIIVLLIIIAILYFTIPTLFLYKIKVKTVNGGKVEDAIPIVKGQWFFGNCLTLVKLNNEQLFSYFRQRALQFPNSYLLYIFNYPILNVVNPEYAEQVLNSPLTARKSFLYRPIKEFVRSGLLTSYGKKWHTRRKLITPTFHFSILKEFFEVFKEESERLVDVINSRYANLAVSLDDIVPRFTLDTICETAMGVKLTTYEDGDNYRYNVNQLQNILVGRSLNPCFYNKIVYKLFGDKQTCDNYLDKVHHFSSSIINKRRLDFANKNVGNFPNQDLSLVNEKRRNAMLDTLLIAQMHGQNIAHLDICEEVDTFMFEGYETTSIAVTFSLFMLAVHPDVQEKVYEEIISVTNDVTTLTISDYSQFKYLECVIKETMRLYPSVPFISRGLFEDFKLGDIILPKYSMINIHIYDLHRNPKYFPDPEKFDPTRFMPENMQHRHPFVYIPFSAGLRNCIGQKFAMLEMKVFLVNLLRRFQVLPKTKLEDVKFKIGLTLTPTVPIRVEFRQR